MNYHFQGALPQHRSLPVATVQKALSEAIGIVGGARKLADRIGCSRQLIYHMHDRGAVGAHWAVRIHLVTDGAVRADQLNGWVPPVSIKHR